MDWTEVNVKTTNEAIEAVNSIFEDLGAVGVKIDNALDYQNWQGQNHGELYELKDIPHIKEGAVVSAYYPETTDLQPILATLKRKIQELKTFDLDIGAGEVSMIKVKDDDWATAWKKYYHPVRVTRYITVVPSWESYKPVQQNEHVIRLDPGMAFGTGTHPTTQLCIQALEMTIRGGEKVLDVGTGSGVLSIATKYFGANTVLAYDLDEVAVRAAKENLDLNPISKDVRVAANNLLNGVDERADLIVANILADIIVPLVPQAYRNLNSNGYFLTSGIIADKLDIVLEELKKYNFVITEILSFGEWRAVIAKKKVEL
ncbi:50S ribosomal protein L11 methyltransferase [Pediococcus claussenii]|uniref:50S ribosomal protein L11 methyltransferase n=1 Tax=Pediococcus claussenii TaxID=187452 RepID=UPI000318FEF1|nr:50S ribosomal protein L11 methyltransferase [Pediococcus claussenii]ANZ70465.1 ribosomal protein L11 methyltransferase [Pediococcus claussenii]ANZ72280.1 ribosomal protein L11 methyltransferase [Pediococcus claussenii]